MDEVKGKVWKFGDNIDTDIIIPTVYSKLPMDEMKKHVLDRMRPEFPGKVKPGDVIVAGINFGCGSSRESAPAALKALGVSAVVAESFARIFFRNAIAIGLPVITCPQISNSFVDGDELKLDVTTAEVTNVTEGKKLQAQPLPTEMLEVLSKGGIVPLLKAISQKS
ncbi:MAG TPA: 3-isopropylmalate dehydratase small subunit [Dehalococcoidia bacterium]|nr:3-isopropylmalate dehydratase small subunit [Dehalococcoidia bacterium]